MLLKNILYVSLIMQYWEILINKEIFRLFSMNCHVSLYIDRMAVLKGWMEIIFRRFDVSII